MMDSLWLGGGSKEDLNIGFRSLKFLTEINLKN